MKALIERILLFPTIGKIKLIDQLTRMYAVKRKYPVDPSLAEELPVYNYPIRDEQSTSVHVWGKAEHGALGAYLQKKGKMKNRADKRFTKFNRPLRLTFAELNNVTDVAAGYGFTIFVVKTQHGDQLFGSGINTDSQIGVHEPRRNAPLGLLLSPAPIFLPAKSKKFCVRSVSAGRAHSAVVDSTGALLTFGNNAYGQCGRTVIDEERYSGSRIIHVTPHFDGEPAKAVECGQDHTLILTDSGKVYASGWGADGQTGLGHYNSTGKFTLVKGDIEGETIRKISSKGDCVLALNDKGDVFGWGNSEYSQLFNEDEHIQQVCKPVVLKKCRGFGKIIDVAAAGSHCLMLNADGDVFSWGYGILGQGPAVQQSWSPTIIPGSLFGRNEFRPDSRVTSIYVGLTFSAAITNYGDLYTWGRNRSSCLGLGNEDDQFFPLRVSLGLIPIKLSLGVDHVVCLTKV